MYWINDQGSPKTPKPKVVIPNSQKKDEEIESLKKENEELKKQLSEIITKEKLLFVSYNFKNACGHGSGSCTFSTKDKIDGEIIEKFKKHIKDNFIEDEETQVVILNIINLSSL
jgi:hypothetical protein